MTRYLLALLGLCLASFAAAESPREANVRLWLATLVGTEADVAAALEAGAEIDARSEAIYAPTGSTALHFAVERKQIEMVRELVRRGADPALQDASGNNVLHLAVRALAVRHDRTKLDTAMFDYLLGLGVDLEATNHAGHTPLLHVALHAPTDERLQGHLIDRGANVDLFAAAALGHRKRVADFVKADATALRAATEVGETALHLAVRVARKEIVEHLIEAGADINNADRSGRTPLHASVSANGAHDSIVRYLLEHGADVASQDRDGRTPLHLAAMTGTLEQVQWLLAHKADASTRAKYGQTPLHWARTAEIAEALIDAGAPLNAKDRQGRTPLVIMEDY